MRNRKLRTKMVLWYAVTIVALLCAFFVFMYFSLTPALENQVAERISADAVRVAGEVEDDDDDLELDNFINIDDAIYSIYDTKGNLFERNHSFEWLDELPLALEEQRRVSYNGQDWLVYDTIATEEGEIVAYVRTGGQLDLISNASRSLLLIFLVALPVGCAIALLVGSGIAKRSLRPIENITRTADAIAQGDLSQRVDVEYTDDEVGRLAKTFNTMLRSLESSFDREKQFTSDASHELRTPLSVILANAQSVLDGGATNEEYRQSVSGIYGKAREMQAMLEQMLMLARGYEKEGALEIVSLNLSDIVEDIAEEFRAKSAERGISLTARIQPGVRIRGDLMLVTRAVMNVLENSVKYGKNGGWTKVRLLQKDAFALLVVEDNGIGIAEGELPHIFNRFYRVDVSRAKQGHGLGLAIVQRIVQLHDGHIHVESKQGAGSVFTLAFPICYP